MSGSQPNDDRAGHSVGTPAEAPQVLPALFELQVDAHPRSLAVIAGPDRATYAELEARANRIAHHLARRGIGRGALVGVLLPRSLDPYAAILGLLKAGAAYVPIDVSSPPDRVQYIPRDCGAKALVTTSTLARQSGFAGAVVRMDADRVTPSALPWPSA